VTTSSGPRPLLKPPRSGPSWGAFTLLGLGLVSTLLLLGGDAQRERHLAADFALVRAAAEIEAGLTTSHLAMAQYAAGDRTVPQQEIWRGIERSLALVHAMLAHPADPADTAQLVDGPWPLRPSGDPALRARAAAIERDLQAYAGSTLKLAAGLESGEPSGSGSASRSLVLAEHDRAFKRLRTAAADLRAAAEGRLAHRLGLFRLYSRAIVAGWLGLVALAFLGFRRFEARRRRSEAVLRDRDLQLVQAQKLEAVGRVAGGLAHDINNYLAAIRSQCELVQRKPQPPERVAEKMGLVIGSVNRASTLIGRLLAFSRRQPIHPEVINLNPLVLGLEKMVHQHLGERIAASTHLAPELWNVKMDPAQLEQVLINLVVNARDAMPDGGKLVIETANVSFGEADREQRPENRPVTAPGDYVLLSVADTGVGIPAEIKDKIFEPFFTTKEGEGNSGLGLATIYGIVQQNGGNVRVESEAGKGTTFRVYLPVTMEEALPSIKLHTPSPASGGDERILLVEDNAEVRASTLGLLESVGYSVTVAADGTQALAAVESATHPFDLLLTDVVLPGLSGPEVAERVRARQGAILRVIFVSGYSESVIHYHGLLQPGVNFLGKPFAAEALFRKVREALTAPIGS
jgi:signal transduction histidine kinase/ActR/RegA family two-component response regulator